MHNAVDGCTQTHVQYLLRSGDVSTYPTSPSPNPGCTTFCYCRPHYFYLYEVRPPM